SRVRGEDSFYARLGRSNNDPLMPSRSAPGADLLGVLAIVMGAVAVDEPPCGLPGLIALGRHLGCRVHKVLVGLVELEQYVRHRRPFPDLGELGVPGVDVVVRDALRDGPLAAREAFERWTHLSVPAGNVRDDVLDGPRSQPCLAHLRFIQTAEALVERLVIPG